MKNPGHFSMALLLTSLVAACGGGNDHHQASSSSQSSMSSSMESSSMASSSTASMVSVKYSVTLTNLTAGQPLSPTALVLHKPGYHGFTLGMPASVELEYIAEAGDPAALLTDVTSRTTTYTSAKPDTGIAPGASVTVELSADIPLAEETWPQLSALSMLGNTNDGFTGLDAVNLGELGEGDTMTLYSLSYDAGTENNSESAATVPGPAAGGEGFNPMRDDPVSWVAMHPGVLTQDDGNPDSALTSINRWDNPVAKITITRLIP